MPLMVLEEGLLEPTGPGTDNGHVWCEIHDLKRLITLVLIKWCLKREIKYTFRPDRPYPVQCMRF